MRYATGDSNPATESWLSLASLSEGGLEEGKQHSDAKDHTIVADGCTTAARKSEGNLDCANHVNGDGSQHDQPIDWNGADGAGNGGYGGGELEGHSGGGGGSGGSSGGGAGGGGGVGGGSDSLSSSSDSHSESSSEESVTTNTHTPQIEHAKQQIVTVKSKAVSSPHPHAREDEARQETPERATTTITTDHSIAGDLPPCTTGQRGGLPELPVSAVTVVTSDKRGKNAKGKQTLAG